MDTTDPALPGKYQKLLAEFSKLKNQLILLNMGMAEEQSGSKVLRHQLKEKDRLLKELREEADGREFRNQQLTRRVSVLQDELKHPSVVEQGHESSTFSIFDAELTSKIREISNLHDSIQRLTGENDALRETNKEILLRHSDDQCMIRAQEDVIQQQKVMIDQLSQRQPEAPVADDRRTGPEVDGDETQADAAESDFLSSESKADMERRIRFLRDSIQAADAKAALFSGECQRMKQRLIIANEQKEALTCELSDTRQLLQKLRDELNTSVRNYETQLETMSEHLATMNEKWSKQQIDMDSLLRQNMSQRRSSKTH